MRRIEELETRVVPVVGAAGPPFEAGINQYSGVVQTFAPTGTGGFEGCTGTLLSTGRHILTAAHCVAGDDGGRLASVNANFERFPEAIGGGDAFDIPNTPENVWIHPAYNGDITVGNDIAVIKLDEVAPAGSQRHDIYRGNDEIGQQYTVVGFGRTNAGPSGFDGSGPNSDNAKLYGSNTFDLLGERLNDDVRRIALVDATSGTVRFGVGDATTDPLPLFAANDVYENALEALSTVGVGNVRVFSVGVFADPTWFIHFTGALSGQAPEFNVSYQGEPGVDIQVDSVQEILANQGLQWSLPAGMALVSDFDSGSLVYDAIGQLFGPLHVGVGDQEAKTAKGDSGGPSFLDGRIAGVTSGAYSGTSLFGDSDDDFNDSFGEFAIMTRVSAYASSIDYFTEQPYDLKLRMQHQPGAGDSRRDLIVLDRVGGVVNVTVNGVNALAEYFPGRIQTVLLEGTDQNETFTIDLAAGDPTSNTPLVIDGEPNGRFESDDALQIVNGSLAIRNGTEVSLIGNFTVSGKIQLIDGGKLSTPFPDFGQFKFADRLYLDGGQVSVDTARIDKELVGAGYLQADTNVDGVVSPGFNSFLEHGILEADSFNFREGSTLKLEITGPSQAGYSPVAGTDYDAIYALEKATVRSGAKLDVSLWYQATPQIGETYTIIHNFGSQPTSPSSASVFEWFDPIENRSISLSEGKVLNLNGIPFRITYQGGDGNDVELVVQDGRPTIGSITADPDTATNSGNDTITLTASNVATPVASIDSVQFYLDANDNGLLDIDADGFLLPNADRQLGSSSVDASQNADWQGYVSRLTPGVYKVFAQARRYTHSQVLLSSPVSTTITVTAAPTPDPSAEGGADARVNSTTTGSQFMGVTGRDASGNTAVVWWDSNAQLARMRRFNSAGAEIEAETTLTGAQRITSIAMKSDGSFVAVWTFGSDLFAQKYTANGAADGGVITVVNDFSLRRESGRVAVDAAGNFVVVWFQGSYFTDEKAFYRRFAANGTAQGPATRADTDSVGAERTVDVGMDAQGNFVVVWADTDNAFGGERNLRAARFDSTGNRVGDPFIVNTRPNDIDFNDLGDGALTVSVSMNATGDWVAAWIAYGDDPFSQFSSGIYARRYGSDGVALDGTEFRVNTVVAGDQFYPVVELANDGYFAVLFTGDGQAGASAYGQVYGPDGLPLGAVFEVPADLGASGVTATGLAMAPEVDFIAIWTGNGPGDSSGVFRRSFTADAVTNLAPSAPPVTQAASGDGVTNVALPTSDPEGGDLSLRDVAGEQVAPGQTVQLPSGARVSVPAGFAGLSGLAAESSGMMLVYDPNGAFDSLIAGDTATDSFTYTVQDMQGKHTTSIVTLNITDGNDAPVLTSGFPLIGETDGATQLVFAMADIINRGDRSTQIVDVDRDAVVGGIALAGTTGTGVWAYSLDDGNTFQDVGTASASSALLLPANAQLRYTPGDTLGGFATIFYHAWDQTTGAAEDRANLTGNTGGETAFSEAADIASISLLDEAPPRIVAVRVRGTGWNANLPSFEIEVGSNDQLVPIPWTNVDQMQIQFNEAVSVPVDAATLINPSGVVTSATAVAYDPATFTVTFTFPVPLANERLSLDLSAILVADGSSRTLDGEWTNAGGNFPTGDGQPGGDFSFQFTALPADVDGNTQVNVFDVLLTRLRLGQNTTAPGVAPHFDVNGDGAVNVLDVLLTRLRLGNQLPASVSAAASAREAPPVEKTVQASALASALTVSALSRSVEDAVDLVLSTDAGFEPRPQTPEHPVQRSRRLSRLRLDSPSETGAWSQWCGFGSSR